ncbi:hypothetical protein ACJJTC_016343 [Scirpophaga incertulas]
MAPAGRFDKTPRPRSQFTPPTSSIFLLYTREGVSCAAATLRHFPAHGCTYKIKISRRTQHAQPQPYALPPAETTNATSLHGFFTQYLAPTTLHEVRTDYFCALSSLSPAASIDTSSSSN